MAFSSPCQLQQSPSIVVLLPHARARLNASLTLLPQLKIMRMTLHCSRNAGFAAWLAFIGSLSLKLPERECQKPHHLKGLLDQLYALDTQSGLKHVWFGLSWQICIHLLAYIISLQLVLR